jgi:hypothetical protein
MVNGKWNCFASLRRDSKSFSSMKLFLAMFPLILVAVFVIVSILSPKEIEEIVDLKYEKVVEVVNSTHNDNFNHSSSTSLPFPVQAIQILQQSVRPMFLSFNISMLWSFSSCSVY